MTGFVLKQAKSPRLPSPPLEYNKLYMDQFGQVLTLYFNQLDNVLGGVITGSVYSFKTDISGFTPTTPTGGDVTLSGVLNPASGGTGLTATPTNGQLLIGNGTGYTLNTLTAGTAIGVSNASGSITLNNTGVTSLIAGTGIGVSSATGAVTVSNTGVLSFQTSLSGLTPSTSTTGAVTLAGTLGVSSGGTGAATLTGYVKGSGTSALTASATIPTTDLSGTITNAQLANSTISGVSLGGSLFNLTAGTGVSFSAGTTYNGSAAITISATGSGGSVTSVAATVPSFLSITGSPITTSGTLAISYSGTALPEVNGGTAQTTYATGDLLYASAANTLSKLSAGTNGYNLTMTSGVPAWKPPYVRTSFTATAGQTSFAATYYVGYVQVFMNGVLLNAADYTASSGTAVVLAVAANVGDILETIAYNV